MTKQPCKEFVPLDQPANLDAYTSSGASVPFSGLDPSSQADIHTKQIACIDGIVRESMRVIGAAKIAWHKLADALRVYREEKLWQFEEVKYSGFKEACKRKWGLTDRWAREIINARIVLLELEAEVTSASTAKEENQALTETIPGKPEELVALGKAPRGRRAEALSIAADRAAKEIAKAKRNGKPQRPKPNLKQINDAVAAVKHESKHSRRNGPAPTPPVTASPQPSLKARILDAVNAEVSCNPAFYAGCDEQIARIYAVIEAVEE